MTTASAQGVRCLDPAHWLVVGQRGPARLRASVVVPERAGLHRRYTVSCMQYCTTAAAPYRQDTMPEAASGGTGVSLLEAFPFSNWVPSKRPLMCLLGNSFRGVAAGSERARCFVRQGLSPIPHHRPPCPITALCHGQHGSATTSNSTASTAQDAAREQPNPSRAWLGIARLIYDPTCLPAYPMVIL